MSAADRTTLSPLRFDSAEGGIELSVVGYQFGDVSDSANWLVVELVMRHGVEVFMKRDPSLETVELAALARFFREGAKHAATFLAWDGPRLRSQKSFTEPNLSFELATRPGFFLRVYLAAELLPPFARELSYVPYFDQDETEAGVSEAWLDFPTTAAQLAEAARVVEQWVEAFPVR